MLCGDRCGVGTRTSWAIFGAVTLLRGVWSANLSRGHAYPDDEAEGSTSNRCRQRHERRLPLESSRLTITEYSVAAFSLMAGQPATGYKEYEQWGHCVLRSSSRRRMGRFVKGRRDRCRVGHVRGIPMRMLCSRLPSASGAARQMAWRRRT